ncbi:fumarate lyase superfamily, unknown specificity, bacterial 3-carboxy-cis,cis-muconate cycloisomerase related [Schizosaccharomyces pombe]|uniref:Uncharacterized protein C8E4.05c n=1 Tax=Schizosaccharomyces pombe (strain 972 / ATCC 24843) TaxID=284812 RepID=YBN5_SCHPO|nr:fumarate lyase superfamily [Schizosaccharomyces pombe]O42889.1 RecName: Full=Uncharacterized protein C8E4.05c [Schizosaccharomyces pombe 972h-]CAA16998.1 fumarate lyase superfamily [Schizosaccharomyces pombe]|eukprot:NP_596842.1 fumarate lyase superfamily [Schizosaccharomyces pombe]
MPVSVSDSFVFRNIFGDAEIRKIWSDENRTQEYLNWEAALARAEASLGIIPKYAGEEIQRVCKVENIDFSKLEEETINIGYPVLGVVHQLANLCSGDSGKYCHWGATTQDVTDSATVRQMIDSFKIIKGYLEKAIELATVLVIKHRETTMAGRSNLQQAVPITFGFKMARFVATLRRHHQRLCELLPRVSVLEFGGACGTLASLENKGLMVQQKLAEELGLLQPEIAWHTERDRIAEAGCFLGMLTGTLAKFATDIKLLMQTEVAEVFEPFKANRGSSSTMPQKRNPISCVYITASTSFVRQGVAALLDAMVEDHERATGAWEIEWIVLPDVFVHTVGTLKQTVFLLEGLEVHPSRMNENLSITNGLIVSEAVMMALAPKLGRDEAHDLVYRLCHLSIQENKPLVELLLAERQVTNYLSKEEVTSLLNPENYLGSTFEMIERALQIP